MDPDDIELSLHHVDLDQIPFLHQCDGTAVHSLGAAVADDRTSGRAGKPAVGDEGNAAAQLLIAADGLGGIEHLRHSAALGALVADEHRVALLDLVL